MSPVRVPSSSKQCTVASHICEGHKPVALENGASHFTKEEWDALTPAEKALYKRMMDDDPMHLALKAYTSKVKSFFQILAGLPQAMGVNVPLKAEQGEDQKKP